jgi:hypothetical protein
MITFTFKALDKTFTVECKKDVSINTPEYHNEVSIALTKANREFLDSFLAEGTDPFPGWWNNSSPTDFYWSLGNNFD